MDERAHMTATIARISGRSRRAPDVRDMARDLWDRIAGTEQKRTRLRQRAKVVGPIVLVLAVIGAWLVFRPTPMPDYKRDSIKKVFSYTLFTDEFNKLPIEKRLELLQMIVERIRGMSAGESALLAAFAAGIAGKAREQLEENASRLAIDMWDRYARDYNKVPDADRGAYLDRAFIEMGRAMETVGGDVREVSDADRLAEGRQQAQRDLEMLRTGRGPSTRALSRMFTLARDDVGGHANPAQRTRGQLMMRDMIRRLRGEPLTGPR